MKRIGLGMLVLAWVLVGCGKGIPADAPLPIEPRVLRVMTYSSFSISEKTIAAFEAQYDATVQFLDAGDAGAMLNQAILSKDAPQADVIYGVDNTFLSRAIAAEIAAPLAQLPETLANIPDALELDPAYRFLPVDYGDVCLNYDRAYFETAGLPAPKSLEDLIRPEYADLLVVENPASSSPGLAFLIATVGVFGQDGYLDYWQALRENGVLVVEDWDTAYYGEFSGGAYSEGARPLVVSYATSPAAEVFFSEEPLDAPPTGAVVAPGTCFRQVEFVAVLKNSEVADLAQAFVAFATGKTFQADIPLNMWVFPANTGVTLPQVFLDFALEAQSPVEVPAALIELQREAWIEAWTITVLR